MNKIKDPGFGYASKINAKRLVNQKGESTIIHLNKKFNFQDTYTYLIQISWPKFFLLVFCSYLLINIIFGIIYTLVGIEEITTLSGNTFKDFLNGFFFSAQTITTVGYGGISPHGLLANIVSSFEALIGLLTFSFITGLLYGRFSKPNASIRFSKNIIFRNFNDRKALMFRLMNNRTSIMIDSEISLTMSITKITTNNKHEREFYRLNLEMNAIKYLSTTWTIVHEIDEESPLFNLSESEIKKLDIEFYILAQYHEESFSQKVYQIHSYTQEDLEYNVKFASPTSFNNDGFVELDHEKLSTLTAMED
ncbi:ion transporter [Lutibacter sp. HS1-25]|uniref:ion channel n=1 Tax=Lutibacter sp. HS1-25 TaxID=2485000 RepID=UPI0010133E5C|nr:ion channel [Lutibacter sp. HS1-25]RXP56586.1 ion transporter [Lutibacter sp. HS1-25]